MTHTNVEFKEEYISIKFTFKCKKLVFLIINWIDDAKWSHYSWKVSILSFEKNETLGYFSPEKMKPVNMKGKALIADASHKHKHHMHTHTSSTWSS